MGHIVEGVEDCIAGPDDEPLMTGRTESCCGGRPSRLRLKGYFGMTEKTARRGEIAVHTGDRVVPIRMATNASRPMRIRRRSGEKGSYGRWEVLLNIRTMLHANITPSELGRG